MQLCAITAMGVIQNPRGIPTTTVELDRTCSSLEEAIDCTNDYTKRCLPTMLERIVSIFMGEFEDLHKEFCSNGTLFRTNFIKYAPCLNEVQKKQQKICIDDFRAGFDTMHSAEISKRMSLLCW